MSREKRRFAGLFATLGSVSLDEGDADRFRSTAAPVLKVVVVADERDLFQRRAPASLNDFFCVSGSDGLPVYWRHLSLGGQRRGTRSQLRRESDRVVTKNETKIF